MELLLKAIEAIKNAYCPYSSFSVGCAVEMESGKIYTGTNVENSSYGATLCAERVAVAYAVSQGERKIKKLAITSSSDKPVVPCGMCLQVIQEFGPEAEIICGTQDQKEVTTYKTGELLGKIFDKSSLKKES